MRTGMLRRALALGLALAALSSVACSHSKPATVPTAEPAPPGRGSSRADAILIAFERKHPLSPVDDPLRRPTKLEDIDVILHLDQMDLFEGAEAFAARQPGPEATAIAAQIEIAHSEAQLVVADVLHEGTTRLSSLTRTLRFRQESGETSTRERARLAELEEAQNEAHDVEGALREQAAEHARHGAEIAHRIMRSEKGNYRGYRITADYHRLRGDWAAFEDLVAELAKENPSSNGLVFLRGLEAQAEGDPAAAMKLFQTALERDKRFVRAQAHIVLLQTSPDRAHAELLRLAAMNPHHQLVAFAGPFIEAANDAWKAERRGSRPAGATTL
jgi:hypothetical protein